MVKNFVSFSLFGVLALMTLTNPNKNQYLEYSSNKLCRRFDEPYKTICQVGVFTQKENLHKLIEISTDQNNLLLGSLYTTELLGVKVHTVGVFGNFLTLP